MRHRDSVDDSNDDPTLLVVAIDDGFYADASHAHMIVYILVVNMIIQFAPT